MNSWFRSFHRVVRLATIVLLCNIGIWVIFADFQSEIRFPKIQNGHAPHFNSTSDSTSNDTNKTGFQNFSDCSFVNHLEFSAKEKKLRFVDKLPPQNKRSLVNFLMRPKKLEWVLWNGDCNIKPAEIKFGVVFLVKSYIKDEIERNIIRQTWGSVRSYDGILFGTVFVVGCDWKRMLNFELEVEQERFDDILQCNVKDKQQSGSRKMTCALQWAKMYLTYNWLLIPLNSKVVINQVHLTRSLRSVLLAYSIDAKTTCFNRLPLICISNETEVVNHNDNKEIVKENKVLPSRYHEFSMPLHCDSGAYVISSYMAADLFQMSRVMPLLEDEVLWITGFIRKALGAGDTNIMTMSAIPGETKASLRFLVQGLNGLAEDVAVKLWSQVENQMIVNRLCKVRV